MIVASLFGGEGEDAEQNQKRINAARDVLTPILGILGTIIGFYFGSQPAKVAPTPIVQVAPTIPPALPAKE